MTFHPGSDRIVEETLELFGLANALFVSQETQGHLSACPYLAGSLTENGERLIIEKLLSVAIKLRFLDDHSKLLETNDRCNAGTILVNGAEELVGLRDALNKIIHHKSIKVFARLTTITVINVPTNAPPEEIQIPAGSHPGFSIIVSTEGTQGKQDWTFNTDLVRLVNETLRVFYFENRTKDNSSLA